MLRYISHLINLGNYNVTRSTYLLRFVVVMNTMARLIHSYVAIIFHPMSSVSAQHLKSISFSCKNQRFHCWQNIIRNDSAIDLIEIGSYYLSTDQPEWYYFDLITSLDNSLMTNFEVSLEMSHICQWLYRVEINIWSAYKVLYIT